MIDYIVIAGALALLIAILMLIRAGSFHESQALSWILALVAVVIVGSVPSVLSWIAALIGVRNPPNILLAFAVFALTIVALYQHVQLSQSERRLRSLIMHLALLEANLEDGSRDPSTLRRPKDEQ